MASLLSASRLEAKSTRAVAGPNPKPALRSSSLVILKKKSISSFVLYFLISSANETVSFPATVVEVEAGV
ncbi:unnamed protein product [Rhizophagus irregularis]|nr:unnamed protein product [Rhizophagus irregularis]CAB4445978.1 unnamed protein product [Rhizophagus irregularis]CAB5361772.1 unnamed protein product [Rhizophagus irregularis]